MGPGVIWNQPAFGMPDVSGGLQSAEDAKSPIRGFMFDLWTFVQREAEGTYESMCQHSLKGEGVFILFEKV